MAGRPTKLTKETAQKVIDNIHMGCFIDTAAAAAGIARSTLHEWLRKGEEDLKAKKRTVAAGFKREYDSAAAMAEQMMVELIDKAAKTEWKAAAWKLERKWPDRWAKRQVLSVTREDGIMTSTMLDLSNLNDTELRDLRTLIKKGAKHATEEKAKAQKKGMH